MCSAQHRCNLSTHAPGTSFLPSFFPNNNTRPPCETHEIGICLFKTKWRRENIFIKFMCSEFVIFMCSESIFLLLVNCKAVFYRNNGYCICKKKFQGKLFFSSNYESFLSIVFNIRTPDCRSGDVVEHVIRP